jgi:hypothetical protein
MRPEHPQWQGSGSPPSGMRRRITLDPVPAARPAARIPTPPRVTGTGHPPAGAAPRTGANALASAPAAASPASTRHAGSGQRARVRLPRSLAVLATWLRAHLTDEGVVALLATTLSIGFFAWYSLHGDTVAFNDARIRAMIGRRVVVSRTPGLAQLGITWLPLDFMLMLPLIWNDTLFRSGIAASLPSMVAYVLAAVYMFRLGRLVSASRSVGWVAAVVLMLNPSLLYMQSTAMSETSSVCAIVISTSYALRVARFHAASDILKCAAAVAAGTLVRYENWVLAAALVPVLAYIGWRYRGSQVAEAWTILYGILAFAGCVGWVIYNGVIFHDPLLSFFYGQSSHTYYANTPASALPARHHPWVALEVYGYTIVQTVGWTLVAMALVGFSVFVWRARLRVATLPAYLTLVPFAFYWLVLYAGINTESLPEFGMGRYYNVRFGLLTIPAVALFAALLATAFSASRRRLIAGAALAAIVLSTVLTSATQTPLVLREALYGAGSDGRLTGEQQAHWFGSHYRGGDVLITYVNDPSMMFFLLTQYDLPDRALITDASGWQFTHALEHPETTVTWIVMNSDASNGESKIWTTLSSRQDWRKYFALRQEFGTTQIYERITNTAGVRADATTGTGDAAVGSGRPVHPWPSAGTLLKMPQ